VSSLWLEIGAQRRRYIKLGHCPIDIGFDGREFFWESAGMRLTASEIAAIREEIGRLDPQAEVYLYGSRVDDTARGGDVDLLVISETLGFREVLRLRMRILDRIGWQQLDLLVRRRDQMSEPLAAMALETGVKL
jgi:predicted nucleotidyltransferase